MMKAALSQVEGQQTNKTPPSPAILRRYSQDQKVLKQLRAELKGGSELRQFIVWFLENHICDNLLLEAYGDKRAFQDGQIKTAITLWKLLN